jgi:hypothetical protein
VSGLIMDGRVVPVPGRRVVSWKDDPLVRLKMSEDGRRRSPIAKVRQVIIHTTRGIPGGKDKRAQVIRPGLGPSTWSRLNLAKMWADDDRNSGAHYVVDFDGTIYALADAVTELTYHATTANPVSVGIEIKQGGDAELYAEQLEAVADLVDVLTLELGIQRQIPSRYRHRPFERLAEMGGGGRDVVGVFGHRDQTARRGAGDPGDEIYAVLARRGYERLDFEAGEDLLRWKERQAILKVPADGVPGPATTAALARRGFKGGLWMCPPDGLAELVG